VERVEDLNQKVFKNLRNLITDSKNSVSQEEIRKKYCELIEDPLDSRSKQLVNEALETGFLDENPSGWNIGINEGSVAGQTIPHLHIHVVPRYEGDIDDPEGGVRNIFPEKANYR